MSSRYQVLEQMFEDGRDRGLVHHFTEETQLNGREVTVDGKTYINFGSCSYMGLEQHPALIEGAVEALTAYGTQFSSSRTYLSVGLYKQLEQELSTMFGQPALVTASTTLGHLSALPVLVEDEDAVVLDMQVHSSVQMACELLKARGVSVSVIRHNDMNQLERKVRDLRGKHRKIWYLADGIYSMYGDVAPLDKLTAMMDTYESLHLYIDDAHGMSWAGANGTGYVRSQIKHHPKMVLAVSLNKAFASAGGCLLFADQTQYNRVRELGGTMIFSGPIQPPMLGAALASAKLHQSDLFKQYQAELADLTAHMNQRLREAGLPQFETSDSPLFFVPVGLPRIVYTFIDRLKADGFFINPATFPAVPMRRGGLRFMVNRNLSKADIDALVAAIAYHYPRILAEEGSSLEAVAKTFRIPAIRLAEVNADEIASPAGNLCIARETSIAALDWTEWDRTMGGRGSMTAENLDQLERIFNPAQQPENHWDFHYFQVRDSEGRLVLSTFFTVAMLKDDMFASALVSRRVEACRETDPFYLTSRCLMLGCPITKGNHLFLDDAHPEWQTALSLLLDELRNVAEQRDCNQMFLRDFDAADDARFSKWFLNNGFVRQSLPMVNKVQQLDWTDRDEYLARLGQKYRYNVRKEILCHEDKFEISYDKCTTEQEILDCYELYLNVFNQAFEMNVFRLPLEFFEMACTHAEYDLMRLYLVDENGVRGDKPVGVMFSHVRNDLYAALIVGLDYSVVRSHGVYKQALFQTVQRARALNCAVVDLAYTADLEKKKVGARPEEVYGYVQVFDHYNYAVLESFAKESAAPSTKAGAR